MGKYQLKRLVWAGLTLLVVAGCGGSSNNVASEVVDDAVASGRTLTISSSGYSQVVSPDELVDSIVRGGGSGRVDPRLPGYSYFQGIVQAKNHILLAGQVRVVGGVLGADEPDATVSLYRGAMITSNPDAFLGAGASLTGGPDGIRTRISSLEEIPSPP